ncbi:glycerophosphodiester phosphodiesterase [Paenibacillus hamazuiensis]|uniref:glycerophosphodiester phosphodiesterase n=1 Tax=Paenibacillus hamazuiensis TaxID=2936508 RepID=UPI00200D6D9A|nr:glycerophosphodiester phosphodiesterase [Paenibacillus hamazuiensis]
MTLPWITAHTGCMNTPDNSLESLRAGLAAGADIVEVDVGATKDLVPVLLHDNKIVLEARGACLLSELTYEELKNDRIYERHGGGFHPLVSLADILPIVKESGKRVNLDLKDDACIGPMAELVHQAGMLDQVFLSGAETERALYLQENHPEFNKLLNATGELFQQADYPDAIRKTCEDALAASCIGINIHYGFCRPELMELASSHGLPIYVWTVNEEQEMRRMIELGVRSITTRNVPLLATVLSTFKNRLGGIT